MFKLKFTYDCIFSRRYVNGRRVISRTKHRVSKEKIDEYTTIYRLTIDDCEASDEGEYKIIAENTAGESEALARLKLCGMSNYTILEFFKV